MTTQSIVLRDGGADSHATFAVVQENQADDVAALSEAMLSEPERVYLGGLRFPAKRHSFLLGRLAAKQALGAFLEEADLRNIGIDAGVFGQPLVRHSRAIGIEVSVSHSHGLAVALAYPGRLPMGVDLETVSAISAGTVLGELSLSEAERGWLAARETDEATACAMLWSAREALGKSMKIGLNCPLGILALGQIGSAGDQAWIGQYVNFPQSRCLLQVIDGRVLSMALPRAAECEHWPRLR